MTDYQFRLIDSTYSMDEAKEVLMDLISSKIKFINHKIFSIEERYGSDTDHLKRRVEELRAEKEQLEKMFNGQDGPDKVMELSCSVFLSVKQSELLS